MDNSLIRESVRIHYFMQLSSYFSELVDCEGVSFAFSDHVTDTWYNQAYGIALDNPNCNQDFSSTIRKCENVFQARNRTPCFYFTSASVPKNYKTKIRNCGYDEFDNESWMFFSEDLYVPKRNKKIKIKSVTPRLLDTFAEFYRIGLPGPEVEGYVKCVLNGFMRKPPLVNIKYYLAFFNDVPVGMISLLTMEKYAGLYAVAVDENYQRMRICSTLVDTAIQECKKNNIKHIFLQTGYGEDSEKAFSQMGFKTEFVRIGYAQKTVINNLQHG